MELINKVALITGASKGIGKSIALELARQGVKVAISARSQNLLEQVAGQVQETGSEAFIFSGDMSVEDDIKKFVDKTVQHFGGVDILVNNAGVGHFGKIADFPTQKWDEMFNLNVRGLFLTTRECLPYLRQAGESVIINVVSLAGKNTFAKGGGYTASKHAVLAFSRCLMLEERENGIRVLAICPGSVATSFSGKEDGEKRLHITQAEDVAASIIHMIELPQRAMVSEIDIRPTNP